MIPRRRVRSVVSIQSVAEDRTMTGTTIGLRSWNAGRPLSGLLLIGVGVALGLALASAVATAGFGERTASHPGVTSLGADAAYQAYRSGERAGTADATGGAAFQEQRAGERTAGSGSNADSVISNDVSNPAEPVRAHAGDAGP
jgi:hypothetical protein